MEIKYRLNRPFDGGNDNGLLVGSSVIEISFEFKFKWNNFHIAKAMHPNSLFYWNWLHHREYRRKRRKIRIKLKPKIHYWLTVLHASAVWLLLMSSVLAINHTHGTWGVHLLHICSATSGNVLFKHKFSVLKMNCDSNDNIVKIEPTQLLIQIINTVVLTIYFGIKFLT